ncbi:MAG: nucleotide exchange factor GrpE [Candidatus Competibacteraceae bacterium]|nr:nucleotide exchange factor GrpE [Candidatus Competibacteraceae bacterium]
MSTATAIAQLTTEAQYREGESYQADMKAIVACEAACASWRTRAARLHDGVKSAQTLFEGELDRFSEVQTELPNRFHDDWYNRYEGLRLLTKTLTQLPDQLAKVSMEQYQQPLDAPLTAQQWTDLLQDTGEWPSAYKRREQILTERGNARYQQIFQAREQLVQLKQGVLDCIVEYVLPVLDGLDEGERLSRPLIEASRQESTAVANILIAWRNSYAILRTQLLPILEQVGIRQITIKPGMLIDYYRHEPCAVEFDPNAVAESINAEVRKGYDYVDEDDRVYVLRPAQVVVFQH